MARLLLSLLVAALALTNSLPVTGAVSCDVTPDAPTPAPTSTPDASDNGHTLGSTPSMTPAMTTAAPAPAPVTSTPAPDVIPPQPTSSSPTPTSASPSVSVSPSPSPTTSSPTPSSTSSSPSPSHTTTTPGTTEAHTMGLGTCYEPMHSQDYASGNKELIAAVLDRDLAQLREHFAVLRTYHSQYFGLRVADYASHHGLKLFIGLSNYPGRDDWSEFELRIAVESARDHPGTVEAILVGSEDLTAAGGSQSVDSILDMVQKVRSGLEAAGVPKGTVLVGTAQRVNELLSTSSADDMDRLVAGCDVVGVNIYPFFTAGFDARNPAALLEAQWAQLRARYGDRMSKLRVTETGWPSAGGAPVGFPGNVPSPETQRAYFHAVADWKPHDMAGAHFWFMAYDRRSDDAQVAASPYEQYFGVFTAENADKGVL